MSFHICPHTVDYITVHLLCDTYIINLHLPYLWWRESAQLARRASMTMDSGDWWVEPLPIMSSSRSALCKINPDVWVCPKVSFLDSEGVFCLHWCAWPPHWEVQLDHVTLVQATGKTAGRNNHICSHDYDQMSHFRKEKTNIFTFFFTLEDISESKMKKIKSS